MAFSIDDRRWSDLLDTLRQTGPDPQYLSRIPYEVRQLSEARSKSQAGAEVESRNRVARNVDALGTGAASLLSRPDAGPDELQYVLRLEAAKRREDNQKAMQERLDVFGTPYSYEARNRAIEGGVYRDEASTNRMLRDDPARLVAELEKQQAASQAPVDLGDPSLRGGYGVIASGRGSDQMRAHRLAELLGIARTEATDDANRKASAKVPKPERERQYFAAAQEAAKAAEVQGVDTVIAAIRERAGQDAETAAIAARLIKDLRNRRVNAKDLQRESLGQSGTVLDPEGALIGGQLPAHRGQAEEIRKLRQRAAADREQAAAERGYW